MYRFHTEVLPASPSHAFLHLASVQLIWSSWGWFPVQGHLIFRGDHFLFTHPRLIFLAVLHIQTGDVLVTNFIFFHLGPSVFYTFSDKYVHFNESDLLPIKICFQMHY